MSGSSALCVYDFTASCGDASKEEVIELLEKYCKKWCFQQEKSAKNGYLHFQGRFSLKVRVRIEKVCKMFGSIKAHISPTSNECKNDNFYVMKEDTRVDGPWDSVDFATQKSIPIQYKAEPDWYPWQKSILESIYATPDQRQVNVVVDDVGCQGKTTLVMWLFCRNRARKLPFANDYEKILQNVCDRPVSSCYFIDLPRGLSESKMGGLMAGIEEIKNGYAFDSRHYFKEVWFDTPHIWVFCNTPPDPSLLSRDRWVLWSIDRKRCLVKYDPDADIDVSIFDEEFSDEVKEEVETPRKKDRGSSSRSSRSSSSERPPPKKDRKK